MTIRDIAIAFGFTVDEASAKKAEGAVTKLKSFATKALATIGIGISLTQMNKLVEEWYSVNKVLANVNTQLKDQSAVQNRITEAANACRITYAEMCGYATSLVKTGSRFFSTVEDATDFLELANKAFKVSGASEAQMNSLNNVLKNTFQTGKLSAGGFNTIMQQSPDIIQYLADSLGVSMQQVKALGLSGSITAKQLKNAFTQSAEGIESAYGKLRLTVSDALRIIRNEFGTWLYQTDEGLNLTNDIAKFLIRAFRSLLGVLKALVNSFQRLVNLLGSTRRAAALVAAAVGAMIVAFKYDKIVAGIKAIGSAFAAGGGKIMLIVAAVLLCIAVLDGLIAFANGDDSFIGNLFEKFGVDAEELRKTLKDLFAMIKQVFGTIFQTVGKIIKTILPTLSKLLQAALTIISKMAQVNLTISAKAWEIIIELLDMLIPIIEMILELLDPILEVVMLIVDAAMMLVDVVMALIKPLLELISAILKPIMAIVKVLVQLLSNQLGQAFKFIANVVNNLIAGPLRGLLDFLGQIIKFISAVFTGDWETAWKALGNIPIAIINSIIGAFEGLINFFIGAINGITSALSSLWTWIGIPGIPEIPEVQFGRISYLAKGGYVDKNKPTPVVIGDNKQEGEIVSPISKMRDTVIDALRIFLGGATTRRKTETARAMEQNTINRNVTQNVYINNTFEGSRDVQKTAATAMKQTTSDTTGELARALAYAR